MPRLRRMRRSVLCDEMIYCDMSWSDLEDLYLIVPWEPRPRTYKSASGLINASALDPQTFRRWFRFEQEHLKPLTEGLRIPHVVQSAQGVVVSGEEALLMTLRRLSYPNRWCDIEPMFGRASSAMSSIVSQVMAHIDRVFGHLLDDLARHTWLTLDDLNVFSQRIYFSGHKRVHALKYQAVMGANGIVCELDGPYPGSRHDAGILGESGLYAKLQRLTHGCLYCIYGDPAYPLRPLLMRPYGGATLTAQQQLFNEGMSTVRQAVEWGFGKVIAEFAFVDFKKNQKILLQNVGQMYRVATLLTNCHTCLYGSQTGMYFGLCAPLLEDYLVPRFN
ncbi:hypothetical protein HPB52_003420 [Rhipicephalus sanguineus]|uniref:DDE Tnp4 domain-containing protein n=1 Tax=Rhipicephalus sanguineus TaxID=34632 RepID=A0A9D4PU81_RHISA|nr:hypothetical protein HPB52_003420 [Rhipicephalus sanguineus]